MAKNRLIKVKGIEINISTVNDLDFISITDMIKAKDGDFFVSDWLRNRNTLEYIGAWEAIHNPNFNYGEFAIIKDKSGLNNFKISVKELVKKTNSIGISAKSGRYGGTYAHVDIAFNFGMWISPAFQLYVVKEYQRLKESENNSLNLEWNVRRILSKANYRLHTDAIKDVIIPKLNLRKDKEWFVYANEADLLNVALFGCTAKEWKAANPKLVLNGKNMRDFASINELTVLTNLESLNSILIKQNIDKKDRFKLLKSTAKDQLENLTKVDILKSVKRQNEMTYLEENEKTSQKKLN